MKLSQLLIATFVGAQFAFAAFADKFRDSKASVSDGSTGKRAVHAHSTVFLIKNVRPFHPSMIL